MARAANKTEIYKIGIESAEFLFGYLFIILYKSISEIIFHKHN